MTGWIVAKTSSCGLRRMLSRFRHAIVSASLDRVRAARGATGAGATVTASVVMTRSARGRRRRPRRLPVGASVVGSWILGRVAGEREEHVVERRLAQRHRRPARAARASRMRTVSSIAVGAVDDAHVDVATRRSRRCRRSRALGRAAAAVSSSANPTSITVAPSRAFSSAAVPSAITDAVVDDDDAIGEPVGLLEVLRGEEHGGAVGDEVLDHAPESVRLRGSRPVVGSSRKSTGGWWTSAAARSRRRRMPPEYVRTRRSPASVEVEALEQLVDAARELRRARDG